MTDTPPAVKRYPEASPQHKENGWRLDYKLLKDVSEATGLTEDGCSMEQVESVLLAAQQWMEQQVAQGKP